VFSQTQVNPTPRTPVSGFAPKVIQDRDLRAIKSLWVPFTNSATRVIASIDSAGSNTQLLNNGTLSISKGLSTGDWQYLPSSVLATTYQPLITAAATTTYYRGDKTFVTLNTTVVPEGTNLYATNTRALAYVLTGYTAGSNTVLSATDSFLTAFRNLQAQILLKANSDSPTLTGTPLAPTATVGTNTTQIATTAGVIAEIGSRIKYGATDVVTDGTATVFNIPHGMGAIPTSFAITFGDASNLNLVQSVRTVTSTNIVLTCSSPPTSGTQKVYWQAFK
jgi:hypothetical protein